MEGNTYFIDFFELEFCVIGCILIDSESYERVARIVTADDFTSENCKAAFVAAGKLADAGKPIDPITVREQAKQDGFELMSEFLFDCMDRTPTAASDEVYAALLKKQATTRKAKEIVSAMLEDRTISCETMVTTFYEQVEPLCKPTASSLTISSSAAMHDFISVLGDRENGKRNTVSTGYSGLDSILGGGLVNGGLYILAARPGMGKTTLALNLADKIKENVLFVSLEMTSDQINAKRVARKAGIPYQLLLNGGIGDNDEVWNKVLAAATDLSKSGMFINYKSSASVQEIRQMAKSIPDVSAIVIDYLGLIKSEKGSKYEQTTEVSNSLKALALSLNVPILCLCQLSRANEKRDAKRPQMSDLRDSGAIEQDADGVLLLYRDDYYKEETSPAEESPIVMECNLAKNRHGRTGKVIFTADLSISRIDEEQV